MTLDLLLAGICLLLLVTEILTLWYFLKKHRPSKQVQALQKAIAAFEIEGQSVLSITRLPPDAIFLKSPGR